MTQPDPARLTRIIAAANQSLGRNVSWLLAVFLLGILGMLFFEVPPLILDVCLAANIAFALALVMRVAFLNESSEFTSFPVLLLLTSFVRVGLNTSTTRLVLSRGEAGAMLEAFANSLTGGNLPVGLVLFLILTVIQFVVISKGSERASEVTARFVLDALPGKQLSIDNDLRNQLIDQPEAQRRRRNLERESDFHAALEGAMKFVKGEAIVGILITFLNFVAGTALGCLDHGMSLAESLGRFGKLTIGDGLVTLLPSFLVCLAAGVIITRVSTSDSDDSNLATDLVRQLSGRPEANMVGGFSFLLLAALVHGPARIILLMAGLFILVISSAQLARRRLLGEHAPAAETPSRREVPSPAPDELETALVLAVSGRTRDALGGSSPAWRSAAERVRQLLFTDLGVPIPACELIADPSLVGDSAELRVHEEPVDKFELPPYHRLVLETPENLALDDLKGLPYPDPHSGRTFTWVSDAVVTPQLTRVSPMEVIQARLTSVLPGRVHEFMGIQETQMLLDRLSRTNPRLVEEVVPNMISRPQLTDLLRRLVREEVSVRDLRQILEAVAENAASAGHLPRLTEAVRRRLAPQIRRRWAGQDGRMAVHSVGPGIVDCIRRSIRDGVLTIKPEDFQAITGVIRPVPANLEAGLRRPIMLCPADIRPYLASMLRPEFPRIVVLSHDETDPANPPRCCSVLDLPPAEAPAMSPTGEKGILALHPAPRAA